ncbi:MAG: hypothetical protein K5657_06065 [Desulfovibrio sp.]|nr:hypothetical protein [Desulfovibrio sp.]
MPTSLPCGRKFTDLAETVGQPDREEQSRAEAWRMPPAERTRWGKSIRPELPRRQRRCDFLAPQAWQPVQGCNLEKRSLDGRRCKVIADGKYFGLALSAQNWGLRGGT